MVSVTKKAENPPPLLLQRLKKADETLSMPVFQLSLPLPLEFLASLPGNLMGPPCLQFLAPLWLFALSENNVEKPPYLAALALTLLFLVIPFVFFLRGNKKMISHVLYHNASFALSPLLGTAVSYYVGPTPSASALGYHGISLYCLSCIVILFLKHTTRRLRPCVLFPHLIERKNFVAIPNMLKEHASFTSFPSGDVMGATAWALPLMELGYPNAAALLVAFTAFGRMFFLAHHLGDTIAGVAVCASIHFLLGCTAVLPTIGTAEWYHPVLSLATLVVATLFRKSDAK